MIAPARPLAPQEPQQFGPQAQPCAGPSAFPLFLEPALLNYRPAGEQGASMPLFTDVSFFGQIEIDWEKGPESEGSGYPGGEENRTQQLAFLCVSSVLTSPDLTPVATATVEAGICNAATVEQPPAQLSASLPGAPPAELQTPLVTGPERADKASRPSAPDLRGGLPSLTADERPAGLAVKESASTEDATQRLIESTTPVGGETANKPPDLLRNQEMPSHNGEARSQSPGAPVENEGKASSPAHHAKPQQCPLAPGRSEGGERPAPSGVGRVRRESPPASRGTAREHGLSGASERNTEEAESAFYPSAEQWDPAYAATAPSFDAVHQAGPAPAASDLPEAVGGAGSPLPDDARMLEQRSSERNAAVGANPALSEGGWLSKPHAARTTASEAVRPGVFAFGMRLTPAVGVRETGGQPAFAAQHSGRTDRQAGIAPPPGSMEMTGQDTPGKRDGTDGPRRSTGFLPGSDAPGATPDGISNPAFPASRWENGAPGSIVPEAPAPAARPRDAADSGMQLAAAAHRASELREPPPASPVSHEIKLEVGDGDQRVSVRLSERQGQVQLAVHSRDSLLAGELRRDLPSLAVQFEQSGFRTEVSRPGSDHGGDSQGKERWSEPRDGGADQGGGKRDRNQNQDERKKDFKWLFPTLSE